MKKFLQFAGIISLVSAVIAFVLMMATNAMTVDNGILGKFDISGTTAIFGHKSTGLLDLEYKAAPLALIAWILILAGMLVVLCGIVLPLLKVKALEKFSGILDIVALACFVLAGIFMFIVIPSFAGANEWNNTDGITIGAGWVIGGIFAIVAGGLAILPAAAAFLAKKK